MTDRELLELAARAAGYGIPSPDDHDKTGRFIAEVNYDDERVSSANEAMRLAITTVAAEVMKRSEVPN